MSFIFKHKNLTQLAWCCHWWSLSWNIVNNCEESNNDCWCFFFPAAIGYIRSIIARVFCSSHIEPPCHHPNSHTLSVVFHIMYSLYLSSTGNLPRQHCLIALVISFCRCTAFSLVCSKRRCSSKTSNISSLPASSFPSLLSALPSSSKLLSSLCSSLLYPLSSSCLAPAYTHPFSSSMISSISLSMLSTMAPSTLISPTSFRSSSMLYRSHNRLLCFHFKSCCSFCLL